AVQDPAPAQPKPEQPAPKPRPRRKAEDWHASLKLPVDLWVDVTAETIGETAEWTNKVEIADVDGDGRPDILFANGGDYAAAGAAVQSRIFLNRGPGKRFEEATKTVFGDVTAFARVVRARDLTGDGRPDVFVGATFETQSRLFAG